MLDNFCCLVNKRNSSDTILSGSSLWHMRMPISTKVSGKKDLQWAYSLGCSYSQASFPKVVIGSVIFVFFVCVFVRFSPITIQLERKSCEAYNL